MNECISESVVYGRMKTNMRVTADMKTEDDFPTHFCIATSIHIRPRASSGRLVLFKGNQMDNVSTSTGIGPVRIPLDDGRANELDTPKLQ